MRWSLAFLALGLALYSSCQRKGPNPSAATYVGDSACMRCHGAIAQAYSRTWKAHSLLPVTPNLSRIEDFTQPAVYDPHSRFYYRTRWEGDSLYLYEYRLQGRDTVYLRRERLDFVVGSGHQTRSYLLWRNGFLYEAPLTWYVRPARWDLSPGYAEGRNSRFSREIQPACLACHASGWVAVPWTYHRYVQVGGPLGCESCHGPGSAHVQDPTDTTYYWSRWSPQQQMDVCSRCHLEGLAVEKRPGWQPGEALAAYWAIFLPERPELGRFGIASHAERLLRSACYKKGGLTCTSCHHPHPTQAQPTYEQRCLSCHARGCGSPEHPSAGCVSCHMPQGETSDIPHTRFTDHFIRVVRGEAAAPVEEARLLCATEPAPDTAWIGEAYLKWYQEEHPDPARLAKALEFLERKGRPEAQARAWLFQGEAHKALPWAEEALREDTTLPRLELYGFLLEMTGQTEKALAVWERLAQKAPHYPEAAFRQTLLAYQLGKLPAEKAYARLQALCAEQPWNAQFQYNAGILSAQLGRLSAAQAHLQAALQYEPDYAPAQEALRKLSSVILH